MLLLQRITSNSVVPRLVANSNKILSTAHKLVPKRIQSFLLLQQVNKLAAEFIAEDEMEFLRGKIVLLEVWDAGMRWHITLRNNQLVVIDNPGIQADVVFSAETNALVLMASQKTDPDTLFFNRRLQISGDTELGLELKNLIDQFDLSRLDPLVQKTLLYWAEQL